MHYYGDAAKYDYEKNSFGFTKGDLSTVRAKTTTPLGAGPYKYVSYENNVLSYVANESYFQGCPKTKYINFQEVTEADKLNGVLTGSLDVTDPSISTDVAAAIKEANGNISKVVETAALVAGKLDIYSGNDDQIVPIMACGGKGVISVLSNIAPAETSRMCHLVLEGKMAEAMALQTKYLPVIKSLFCEVNPIPVKAALHAMGYCENFLRLPLVPMEEAHEKTLLANMKAVGLL